MSDDTIKKLYAILEQRKTADPEESYVAQLYAQGTSKMAQKIGEEAMETAIEAISGNPERLKEESADLLFHLMVLWSHMGIQPEDVLNVLESRLGTSGLTEKASRKN